MISKLKNIFDKCIKIKLKNSFFSDSIKIRGDEVFVVDGGLDVLELEDLVDDAVGADAVLLEQDHRRSGPGNLADAHLAKDQMSLLGNGVQDGLADATLW